MKNCRVILVLFLGLNFNAFTSETGRPLKKKAVEGVNALFTTLDSDSEVEEETLEGHLAAAPAPAPVSAAIQAANRIVANGGSVDLPSAVPYHSPYAAITSAGAVREILKMQGFSKEGIERLEKATARMRKPQKAVSLPRPKVVCQPVSDAPASHAEIDVLKKDKGTK